MATLYINSSSYLFCSCSSDNGHLQFSPFGCKFTSRRVFVKKWYKTRTGYFLNRQFRVLSQSQTTEKQIRRCAPFLERPLLSGNGSLASDEWKAVPDIWKTSAEKFGDRIAVVDPYHDPPSKMTYKQLEQEILDYSEGLRVIGIKPDEKLALFAENSCRWLVADQGIMATGAINVVRGSRSSVEELLQIYSHSESVGLTVDNPELFNRIVDSFHSKANMRFVILLWGDKSHLQSKGVKGIPVFNYNEVIKLGQESHKAISESKHARESYIYEAINSDDIATLVYTSGTTGNPKGVMLTHRNLLHQIKNFWVVVTPKVGDRFLSMLPPWHAYERASEYFLFTYGAEQVYSSVRKLKGDLRRYQPDYIVSVPLVYEALYSGIQKQISTSSTARKLIALTFIRASLAYMEFKRIYEGFYLTRNQKQPSYLVSLLDWLWARIIAAFLWPVHIVAKKLVYDKIHSAIGILKAGISGGGSLPLHIDKFFEAIGVKIQNGYGLTESSPVVAARRSNYNVLGSVGHPIRQTEIKVVDPENGEVLPAGSKGIVKVRGPQVMKGYFKNPAATKQVLDEDGWLNTGDIGWIAPHSTGRSRHCVGVLVLEGRAKDTIVLSSGILITSILRNTSFLSSIYLDLEFFGFGFMKIGENVEPEELEEATLRSSLIQHIIVIGQDQRRLGAIIVPNKEEALILAKELSIVDANATELSKDKLTNLLYEELWKWTSGCSFQIGPILVVDEPFTIESGLMTPTMKIRRDRVVALYKEQIDNLYK